MGKSMHSPDKRSSSASPKMNHNAKSTPMKIQYNRNHKRVVTIHSPENTKTNTTESTLFPVGYHHSFNDNTATTKQVQPNHQGDITAAANSLLQLAKPDINTTSSRSNIIISKKPLKCHNHDTISVSTYPPRKSPIIIISRSTSPILGDTRSNNTSPVPMTKTANEAKPSLQTSAPTIEQPAVGSRSQSPIGGGGSSGMDIDVLKSTNLSLERIRLLSTALYTCATNNIEELYRNRRTSSSPTPTSQ